MREVDRLRAEVVRMHRNAGSKISRMKRDHGAALAGTNLDPRRDLSRVKKYNSAQLKAYQQELSRFNSRNVGFVQGAKGELINRGRANRFKRLERRWNSRVQAERARLENVPAGPNNEIRVNERRERVLGRLERQGIESPSNALWQESHKNLRGVRGNAAMDELSRMMDARLKQDYSSNHLERQRNQFLSMADKSGGLSVQDRMTVLNMSDDQFNVFFNETQATRLLGYNYWAAVELKESERRSKEGMLSNNIKEVQQHINWASTLQI